MKDEDLFTKKVEENMYLVEFILNKFKYDKKDKNDLLQDGYEKLIELVKRYLNGNYNYSLNQYLNNNLKAFYRVHIKRIYKNNKELFCYVDSCTTDFINDLEDKELIEKIENFIFKTDYLTFMQQTIFMARIGYINNIVISDDSLASTFNCSRSNINNKFSKIKELIKLNKLKKKINDDYEKIDDFFSYFKTTKEVIIYFMKNLEPYEIDLLKKVWGDNLDDINGIKNANISEEEALEYYKVVYKLYDAITSADITKVASETCIGTFHMIRKR